MRARYPVNEKSEQQLHDATGIKGYYPFKFGGKAHNGIHLMGSHTVRSIAAGDIIAYRALKNYKTYKI